ncbi:hypothetical protein LCGC14_1385920 [marine sediment metagenome]|uniref:Uncharacterized protein n=1 Tax=marine sediment metagenome TaxID=412755 RepID=A0A0F9N2W8_9ZZZZ
MALIKIKQINNTPASTGGVVMFDGTNNQWSNNDTGAILTSSGTTAQRPTGVNGMIRYNSTLDCQEMFVDGAWDCVRGVTAPAGGVYQMTFGSDGVVRDSWLDLSGNNVQTNNTFGIVIMDSQLFGISYSNASTSVSTDIEIWVAGAGVAPSSATNKFTWSLTTMRSARITTFVSPVTFTVGDKIGIFSRDTGLDANDVVVALYLQITSALFSSTTDNTSGTMTA